MSSFDPSMFLTDGLSAIGGNAGDIGMGGFYFGLPQQDPTGLSGMGLGSLLGNLAGTIIGGFSQQLPSGLPPVELPPFPTIPSIPPFPMPGTGGSIPAGTPWPRVGFRPGKRVRFGAKKHRRMNACNSRALVRAIRRVKRFEKFAKQSVRISHHVKVRKGHRGSKRGVC